MVDKNIMNYILYYSNHCSHSKQLLLELSKIKNEDTYFVCIDKREVDQKGKMNIILSNGQKILLPPNIVKVPSLLLLNRGNRVILGNKEILNFLKPSKNLLEKKNISDPLAFSKSEMGFCSSDLYSYLDIPANEMVAKGNGGMKIMHNYVTLDYKDKIETPPETYTPDKIKEGEMEQLELNRK